MEIFLPIAQPPWSKLGKELESLFRKALYNFSLIDETTKSIAVALSGGKDSLTLLYLLHAIRGRGFSLFDIHAIHIEGTFSCNSSITKNYLKSICKKLGVNFILKTQTQEIEELNCYSCSRMRRKLIFEAAKENNINTIAFGHHKDDTIQTLLLNLFQKGEFAAILPKIYMHFYEITIIRPLVYISESSIIEFAKAYQFLRQVCQCSKGNDSYRKKVDRLILSIEDLFPHVRSNLLHSSLIYGSDKANRHPLEKKNILKQKNDKKSHAS